MKNKTQQLLMIIGTILILSSCGSKLDSPSNRFENLTPPIILIAESKDGAITVCDSKNEYLTLGREWYLAQTISNSYDKGDTLQFLGGK